MHPSLRFACVVSTVVAGALALVPSAFGAGIPAGLSSTGPNPTNATEVQFTWGAAAADLPGNTVTYEIGFTSDPLLDPVATTAVTDGATSITLPVPEGTDNLKVRSIESSLPSAFSPAYTLTVDRTGPTAGGVTLSGPLGVDDWYRAPLALTIVGCSEAPAGCGNASTWTTEGFFASGSAQVALSDALGNPGTVAIAAPSAPFGYDATPPTAVGGQPLAPGDAALVAEEPTFNWTYGADATSGVREYRVQTRLVSDSDGTFTTIAVVPHDPGSVANYSAKRGTGAPGAPALPTNTPFNWRVQTVDKAGNIRNSNPRKLTIDPTVPAAPTITGGPSAPTSNNSPTFTWTGTETTFRWDATAVGSDNPARQGGGAATQTTLNGLADGDYTFRVTQVTEAGRGSAEATRTFKVDTTPPTPPTILVRPTFPAIGAAPRFEWSLEPGAYSRWSVVDAAGTLVYGPIETPATGADLPSFADGPYTFQVAQIDAAGNVSPTTSEAFTVLAPLVAPTPAQNARTAFLAALPKQNALRLTPKAGTTLPTLRPVLRWKKGPRGTKLYNLQIFKVTQRKGTAKPKISKVLSQFPRGLKYRPAKKHLKAGTCYVWRVWPYTGTAFTSRPVGVSNFCIARSKVLITKAKRAKAARVAKAAKVARAAKAARR